MSHRGIASNLNKFNAEVAATAKTGKEYVLGETNSGIDSLVYLPNIFTDGP